MEAMLDIQALGGYGYFHEVFSSPDMLYDEIDQQYTELMKKPKE